MVEGVDDRKEGSKKSKKGKRRFAAIALSVFLLYAFLFVLAHGKAEEVMRSESVSGSESSPELNLSCAAPSEVLKTSGSQIIEYTVLAALVSILCLGIAYGLSALFSLGWEPSIKSEMAAIVLVVAFAGFCYGGGLIWLLDFLGLDNVYREAFDFLIGVAKQITEAHMLAVTVYILAAMAKGAAESVAHLPVVGGALYVLVAAPEAQANLIQEFIMEAVLPSLKLPFAIVLMHISMLSIGALSSKIFLPAGLIMRALPPTKVAGAFLIALTIALWVVFPFTVVYVYKPMYEETKGAVMEAAKEEVELKIENLKNILESIKEGNIGESLVKALRASLDAVIIPMISFFTMFLAFLYTRWVLLPFLNLILLILLVASLTEMMGEGGIITRMVYRFIRMPK